MTVTDETLLDKYRHKARCENCGALSPGQLDPHHLFAKGIGGGGRVDIDENLLALCRRCHSKFHDGNIPRGAFVQIVAKRQGMTPDEVVEAVMRVRNRRKPVQQYEYHPVVNLFPKANPDDRAAMLQSIQAEGVHEPIWLWQGKLVDGRNRLEICQELDIICPFEDIDGDEQEVVTRVFKRNALPRRHLTVTQRAAAAAGMIALMEQVGKRIKKANLKRGGQKPDSPIPPVGGIGENTGETEIMRADEAHRTAESVAAATGVSSRTVERVAAIAKHAEPEVFQAMKDGVVTAGDAEQVVKAEPEQQRRAVRRVRAGKAKTLKEAVREEAGERKDARGRAIPEALAYVVACEAEAAQLIKELHPFVARLNSLEKQMQRHLTWTAGMMPSHIRSVKDCLERLRGGFLCPYCLGDEKDECLKCCRGQRWFTGEHARSVKEPQ